MHIKQLTAVTEAILALQIFAPRLRYPSGDQITQAEAEYGVELLRKIEPVLRGLLRFDES